MIRDLRKKLIKYHTSLNLSYSTKKHTGNFNDLILNQTEQVGAGYFTIYSFWISVLQVISYLILGLILSIKLTIFMIIGYIFIALISLLIQYTARKFSKKYTYSFQELGLLVGDYNNNSKSYRVSKNFQIFLGNIYKNTEIIASNLTRAFGLHVTQTLIFQTFGIIIIFLVIYIREDFNLLNSQVLVYLAALRKMSGHLQDMFNNALAFQNYSD